MQIKYQKEIVAVMIVIVAVLAIYLTFYPTRCKDISCFEAHMIKCSSAVFVNEEEEASWMYKILGTGDGKCQVQVTLLNAKEGNIDLRVYEGTKMICSHEIGIAGYPEKNLGVCHGELKEGLQAVVIEKLYKYIVTNIGEIREEINY